jgi:hypothetical protein
MALGHASPEHYCVLFEELPLLMDEYQRPGKQKRGSAARPEEVRHGCSLLLVPEDVVCSYFVHRKRHVPRFLLRRMM